MTTHLTPPKAAVVGERVARTPILMISILTVKTITRMVEDHYRSSSHNLRSQPLMMPRKKSWQVQTSVTIATSLKWTVARLTGLCKVSSARITRSSFKIAKNSRSKTKKENKKVKQNQNKTITVRQLRIPNKKGSRVLTVKMRMTPKLTTLTKLDLLCSTSTRARKIAS